MLCCMNAVYRSLAVTALILGVGAPDGVAGTVSITLTTTPNGGSYAPKHVVAVWIQNQGGTFVKTIGRWAATRKSSLVAWNTAAGANDADAISGATIATHTAPLTLTWNLLDKASAEVPDGTYTVRMELADSNSSTAGQNHQGTFTFVKGATAQTQTALTNGGFTNVSIDFNPIANQANCNNGALDAGETCDPPGSCPTSCAVTADKCAPSQLVGSAATCTAACVTQTISACVGGDGCCPDACDESSDSDCGAGGNSSNDVVGGCATTDGSGALFGFATLVTAVVLGRRKRR